MPTNKRFDTGRGILVACTYPASPASGGPVLYGSMTGIALKTKDAAGKTVVDFSTGVWYLPVTSSGAIAVGDALFLDATGATISNESTGNFFGFAMAALASGSASMNVMHVESPGAASLGSGTVSATNLASNAVTAVKIASNAVTTAKITDANVTGAKLATGILKVTLAAGTAGGADVTVAGMSAADEICSVLSFTTAASIASVADRTSEYAAGAGKATKAAGTSETSNQLVIIWLLKH